MAKHEEQRLAARFQCLQGKVHQLSANAGALTVGANRQGGEHCCFRSSSIWRFNPDSRKHDMSERPARVFGKSLTQDAAVRPQRVEIGDYVCRPEGVIDELSR